MILKSRLFVLCCLLTIAGLAQENEVLLKIPGSATSLAAFVPDGYDTIMSASGDLNKDKIDDVVLVLKSKSEDETVEVDTMPFPRRILLVLFRKGDTCEVVAKTITAVMAKNDGGMLGDPFMGVSIKKGVLIIEHYGGSAWRWEHTAKFRYQSNAFYHIGLTTRSYWNVAMCEKLNEFAATELDDINYITGDYIRKKVSQEGCKLLENKKGKKPVKPLVALVDYSIDI